MASLLEIYTLAVTVMVEQHACRKAGSGKALLFLFEGMVNLLASPLRMVGGPARRDIALDVGLDVEAAATCVQYSQCA